MKCFRQYRLTQAIRDQYADVEPIQPEDFIYPYFVQGGTGVKKEIGSMKGICRFSIDELIKDIRDLLTLRINKVLLFGVVPQSEKDERGSAGYKPDNIVSEAVRAIKAEFGAEVIVFTDVCLCEYTSHGHCGLLAPIRGEVGKGFDVDNDSTLPLLAEQAYQHALAGADFVAPSAMMDGQIEALRKKLDSDDRTRHVRILAYSAKYASAYYGPFRDAAGSAPGFGDRKGYQMDYRTKNQGLEEIAADIEEGTDWIMVKPALAYLDILYRASQQFPDYPLVAYQVSGEYSMLLNAAEQGFFDEKRIFHESLTAIRRAGAKYIISYYAKRYFRCSELCSPEHLLERKNFLPININIAGKRILIIGGGRVALHKASILHRFTDNATVISPTFLEGFRSLPFTLNTKKYDASDLDGAFLVYVCTEDHAINARIKHDAEQKHVLCSVCDTPQLCDFTSPAIHCDGDVMVAVSSNAKDVRKSMRIRDAIRDNWKYLLDHLRPEKSLYH